MKNNQTEQHNKVKDLLNENKINDLETFLNQRKNLNITNKRLIYMYHGFQSIGIFITTIATGYNLIYLVWIGIGFNCIASLINIYAHINDSILNKLLNNIKLIKDDKYIDESALIDIESFSNSNNNYQNNSYNGPINNKTNNIESSSNLNNQNNNIDIESLYNPNNNINYDNNLYIKSLNNKINNIQNDNLYI